MKIKKTAVLILFIISLVFLLLFFNLLSTSHADTNSENLLSQEFKDILEKINVELSSKYGLQENYYKYKNTNGKVINEQIYNDYGFICYGSALEVSIANTNLNIYMKPSKYVSGRIEYRYLGEDINGQAVSNVFFDDDRSGLLPFSAMNWITEAWNNKVAKTLLPNIRKSDYSCKDYSDILNAFYYFMTDMYGKDKPHKLVDLDKVNWSDYMNIVIPATHYSRGLVVLVHNTNGRYYYKDVMLEAFKNIGANVSIKHMMVDQSETDELSSFNKIIKMQDKEERTFTAPTIKGLRCVGYGFAHGKEFVIPNQNKFDNYINVLLNYSPDWQYLSIVFYYESESPLTPPSTSLIRPTSGGDIKISSSRFDVSTMQPVDQLVKLEVFADKEIVMDYKSENVQGTATYIIIIEQPYEDGPTATSQSVTTKSYSYNLIDSLYCYQLDKSEIYSGAIHRTSPVTLLKSELETPLKNITILEQGENFVETGIMKAGENGIATYTHTMPTLMKQYEDYEVEIPDPNDPKKTIKETRQRVYYNPPPPPDIDYGALIGTILVRNHLIEIGSHKIMDGAYYENHAPTPSPVPDFGSNKFERQNYIIPINIKNATYPCSGLLLYKLVSSINNSIIFENPKIKGNDVHIFTPVGIKANFNKREDLDQRVETDVSKRAGVIAMPIEAPIQVDISLRRRNGENTLEHALKKDIRLSFPAYISADKADIDSTKTDQKFYLEANQPLDIDLTQDTVYVKAAPWSEEGSGTIDIRVYAKNYYAYDVGERIHGYLENTEDSEAGAYDEVKVDVVGRIYDMSVLDFADPLWHGLYKDKDYMFVVGDKDLNGRDMTLTDKHLILPVVNGKNPFQSKKNIGLALGYPVELMLRTSGDFYKAGDYCDLNARYYYIDKKTKLREEVDLYYKAKDGMVKFGHKLDDFRQSNVFMGEHSSFNAQRALITSETIDRMGFEKTGFTPKQYYNRIYQKYDAATTQVAYMLSRARVFRGDLVSQKPDSVDYDKFYSSSQAWYTWFCLPNSTVAVSKDHYLKNGYQTNNTEFLRDGYIVVNFDIRLGRDLNTSVPLRERLAFVNDTQNSWEKQGFSQNAADNGEGLPLEAGDVLIFDLTRRASDEWRLGK